MAECEEGESEAAGNGAQGLGRLGGGIDGLDAVGVEGDSGGENDEKGDKV